MKEAKFLFKNYKVFLHLYRSQISSSETIDNHPSPAFQVIYESIIRGFLLDGNYKSKIVRAEDLILVLDILARFIGYLHKNHIEYEDFTSCQCSKLTDEDVKLLLGGYEK